MDAQQSAFQIGLWGTIGSGKTTYLTMLYRALQRDPNVRVFTNDKAGSLMERHTDRILDDGEFPPHTLQDGKDGFPILQYTLRPAPGASGAPSRPIVLSFVDAPGEFYEDLDENTAANRIVAESTSILDFLFACHGIIILLDPQRTKGSGNKSYRSLLEKLLKKLLDRANDLNPNTAGAALIEPYLAFCVSKIDGDNRLWEQRNRPHRLVEEVMGRSVYDLLGSQFCYANRFQCFAVSSIGRIRPQNGAAPDEPNLVDQAQGAAMAPDPADDQATPPPDTGRFGRFQQGSTPAPQPTATGFKIKNPDEISPVSVIDPLTWLVTKIHEQPPRVTPLRRP